MIQITENIRIARSDKYNLVLQVYRDVNKLDGAVVKEWKDEGFYGDLRSALRGVVKKYGFELADKEIDVRHAIKCIMELDEKICDFYIKGKLNYDSFNKE